MPETTGVIQSNDDDLARLARENAGLRAELDQLRSHLAGKARAEVDAVVSPNDPAHALFAQVGQLFNVAGRPVDESLLLESLLAHAPVGFAFFDRQHRYVRLNQVLAEINGLPLEAHINRSIREVAPVNAPVVEPIVDQVFATGHPVPSFEVTGETPAAPGVTRHWLTGFYPVLAGDQPIYVGAVVLEITERKRGELALAFLSEASSLLSASLDLEATLAEVARLLVPRLADACMLHIIESDQRYHLAMSAHVDPAQEQLLVDLGHFFHYRPGDQRLLLTRLIETRVPVLVRDASSEHFTAMTRDPNVLRLCDALSPTSYMIVPLVARGVVRGTLALAMNQSGRRLDAADVALAGEVASRIALAVDNARLYREARDAIREREALLSVASHELKNPLASLLGYAALLERRTTPGVPLAEREQRHIRTILEQGARLDRMLDVLLDVSRLESGDLVLEHAPVDLALLISRVVAEVSLTLSRHTVVVDVPQGSALVLGDELRLEQVVRNLLGNAVKYSPDGGVIDVEVILDGDQVRLLVRDRGIGIPPESLPGIFQRFSRVRNDASAHIGGLGLGLYVVKEIISRHGGTIEVASTVGSGTTFTVNLPAG